MDIVGADSKILMKQIKRSKFNPRICWMMIGIFMILMAIANLFYIVITMFCIKYDYRLHSVVIATNSRESSLSVYDWNSAKLEGTGVINKLASCTMDVSVTELIEDTANSLDLMDVCINSTALTMIPSGQLSETNIYLGAKNPTLIIPDLTDDDLIASRNVLEYKFFNSEFEFVSSNVIYLHDELEDVYNWITLNYNLGLLNDETVASDLYGYVELGSTSVHISFLPSGDLLTIASEDDLYELSFYDNSYTLFTEAFTCYGKKEANRRYAAQLIKKHGYMQSEIISPCFNTGYSETITRSYLWDDSDCAVDTEPDTETTLPDSYTLRGNSSPTQCLSEISQLFNFSSLSIHCEDEQPCSFVTIKTLDPTKKFVASHYFASAIAAVNPTDNSSYSAIESAVNEFCDKHSLQLDTDTDDVWICFDAMYSLQLLSKGFGFAADENEEWDIDFKAKIGGEYVMWMTGFMLNATNSIEETGYRTLAIMTDSLYLVYLFACNFIIVVGFIICLYSMCLCSASA